MTALLPTNTQDMSSEELYRVLRENSVHIKLSLDEPLFRPISMDIQTKVALGLLAAISLFSFISGFIAGLTG